jgi:K+-sensing histidine kinase KdpD
MSMAGSVDPRRQAIRLATAVVGLAVIWLTVLGLARGNPIDLTVALLIVLTEVLVISVLSGPILAVIVALASVVLINWYLVPPFGAFAIASADNVVALIVFAFVAAVAAVLVEYGARARAGERESSRRAELLGDVVATNEGDDVEAALDRVRLGLHLDYVELTGPGTPPPVLAAAGPSSFADVVVDVPLPDGYRMLGRGAALFAPDPDFLRSLGAAAVRAYESDRLQEESLRADELAAIDRSRTALLASVGHDLRTPLSGLRVSIETLRALDSSLDPQDRDALMETIESSVERLDELITNLLDMSRLQAGAVMTRLEPTDVADVVDRVLVAQPDNRIHAQMDPDLPPCLADPALLERIVANLVSNALRYSPADSVVRVLGRQGSASVILDVTDEGPGIPSEHQRDVFQPFHRVGAQPDGGSGLGLAIVRGFADAMDVRVQLANGPDGGLTARLEIPAWIAPEVTP